jgi:hypothetical protein
MPDPGIPFRPQSDSSLPETTEEWMVELEHLESLRELMEEHNVETRTDLERRIREIEAALGSGDRPTV